MECLTGDPEWVDKARFWSTQARDPDPAGIRNYCHSELGYNYRLSNVLAGIVRGQLEVLEDRVAQRRAVFARYRQAFEDLPGIEGQPEADFGERRMAQEEGQAPGTEGQSANSEVSGPRSEAGIRPSQFGTRNSLHTRWLSCFLIDEAKFGLSAAGLIRFLDAANVEARPVWKPMHTQPLYRGFECVGGTVAEDLNQRGICLPSSSSLSEEEQQFVIDRVREAHFTATNRWRAQVTFSAGLPACHHE